MIVPMKKVSLLVLDREKTQALTRLRKLGLVHIEVAPASGDKLNELKEQAAAIQQAIFTLEELKVPKGPQTDADLPQALRAAGQIAALVEEKKDCRARITSAQSELDRVAKWGDMDPDQLEELSKKGLHFSLREMPLSEYPLLGDEVLTIPVNRDKTSIRFLALNPDPETDVTSIYEVHPPLASSAKLRGCVADAQQRLDAIDGDIAAFADHLEGMKGAIAGLEKDMAFETCALSMAREVLDEGGNVALAHLTGYLPAADLPKLQALARENAWGLTAQDPTEEDNVPTQLKNNKFVSLIYPLTDFLGTVPGYFEYDISGWFLGFMLIFFGIIFGDGGYGLLITGVAAALLLKDKKAGKPASPMFLLIGLLGLATIAWGTLTCTWFGLTPDQLPKWLCDLSLPVISNVNADRLWYPFWTGGAAGLTTAQNLQILCFSLALAQLSVAHLKGMLRALGSLKMLGEIGNLMQLWGMFYVVLTLVVNGQVFPLTLVVSGIPVGLIAIAMVGVGFVLSFIFASYEGSIKDSVLDSCKNIISILLGVVNVFSDIVSYIRLWAVGLAGSAISATVNEMAGPMMGRLTFIVFAVILLVFGHGLNMILNVLSVVVHGVRLNTLEFSSHLGVSWGGHKFDPFKE